MTHIALPSSPVPVDFHLGSDVRLDDQALFEVCLRNPELRIERTAEGNLIVMTPAGGLSGHRNLEISATLAIWARQESSGAGFDSSTGFLLPNGAMRAPDAAWVRYDRLDQLSAEEKEGFLPLCPDFVVELRSSSDRLSDLAAKMEEYRTNGARLGWLVDPLERRVHVYRPQRPVEVLDDPTEVTGDPELPGLTLDLERIWAPL